MNDHPLFKSPEDFAAQVLDTIKKIEGATTEEHDFRFYLYLDTEVQAQACVEPLQAIGLAVEVKRSAAETGKPWLCSATQRFVPEPRRLTEIGSIFLNLASRHGGEFDGWEIQPKRQNILSGLLEALIKKSPAEGPEALFRQAVLTAADETPESLAEAARLLTQAADQGHAQAQYLLGSWYLDGLAVPKNDAEALKRYRQAAEQGNPDAYSGLGKLYHDGLGVEQDYAEAFKWYQKGAEKGSADSEFGLGLLYSDGLGVEADLEESLKWFRRAAQSGNESAALNVGLAYLNGKGIEPDAAEAAKWFAQAADGGSVKARFNLGVLHEKGWGVAQDFSKAAEMYQTAVEQGHAGAMVNLGMLYANGRGVTKSDTKAAQLYRQAADAGNLTALVNLAVLYQHGRGVAQDHAEAARLCRQAADAGLAGGQYNLATLYHRGIGVPKDDTEAMRWYRLAAAQNHPSALNNIGDAYENGYGVAQDYVEAAKWYRKAAERGVASAQYCLAILYRDGHGVEQNYHEAEKWLKNAVTKGHEKSQSALDALYGAGQVERPAAGAEELEPARPAAKDEKEGGSGKIVSPQAAARRALCLRELLGRSKIEAFLLASRQDPNAAKKLDIEGLRTEARQINDGLKDQELWLGLSHQEKELLTREPGSWPEKMLLQMSWRAEALGVIGWALQLTENILPYDAPTVTSSFMYHLMTLVQAKELVGNATLRDEKEILRQREIAENWLWRARTTQIQKEPDKYPPPAGWTYEKIIQMAAEHWEKEGLFKAVRGDYPARGKAYGELTETEWHELRSIATERLYGLNWLCQYSADWDAVPTET